MVFEKFSRTDFGYLFFISPENLIISSTIWKISFCSVITVDVTSDARDRAGRTSKTSFLV